MILAVPFTCDMNGIALRASPLLRINLLISFMHFLLINDHDMVRDTMRLIR